MRVGSPGRGRAEKMFGADPGPSLPPMGPGTEALTAALGKYVEAQQEVYTVGILTVLVKGRGSFPGSFAVPGNILYCNSL